MEFAKVLEKVKEAVFKEKPVFATIYKEYGEKNWLEYLKKNKVSKTELTKENLELIEAVEELLTPLLGEDKALNVKETLENDFFVSTADHHGILCHPFFLNSALVRSHRDAVQKNKSTIIFSCGGVSLSNSSFPRGIFFHNEELQKIRIPFVSLKYRQRPVYGLPALSKEIVEKSFDKVIAKSEGTVEKKLLQIKERFLSAKKVFEVKTYSEQCTIINEILWQETFGGTRGNLIYLEMETVVEKLLEKIHLNKDTSVNKILFNEEVRKKFLKNMEGVTGAHDSVKQKGSHLFWFIDGDVRKQLFLQGESLKVLGEETYIELTPRAILEHLKEKKLLPTMALSYSVLSFYHGLTCGGGFSQVQYLGEMKEAYEKTFVSLGGFTSKLPRTDIFTGEFVLATLAKKKNTLLLTTLDLFIYGETGLSSQIDKAVEKTTVKESLDAMMPEFYKIITGKQIDESVATESLQKIAPMINLKKQKPKCIYCGNSPTNHFVSYIMQSLSIPVTPLVRLISLADGKFPRVIIKGIMTPYLIIFKATGMLKMNRDKNKANTKRSEVIWAEAEKRGILMEQFVLWGKPIEQYRAKMKNKKSWFYFESIPLPEGTVAHAYNWMDDKAMLKKKFIEAGVPVAYGGSVSSFKKALQIFNEAKKPVIVKPQLGSRGRHTTTYIHTEKELEKGFKIAKKLCHFVVVEEHLVGSVYRATYVGGEIVGILRGDPPRITGNGVHTISELINIKNENKKEQVKDVLVTDLLIEFIGRLGFTLETVLPKNVTIDLSEKIGINYGGNAVEEIPKAHPKLLAYLKKAGDYLKAPVVGFDFIVSDVSIDPDEVKWGIIEANSLPFINLHHFPLEGEPVNVAGKVWDLWGK